MNFPDIPPIANGTYLPPNIEMQIKKEEERQQQMDDLKRIADSAESQAKSSAVQAELAVKQSQKSDIKSWIAIFISIFALIVEFMAYHNEIFSFISKLSAK